MGTTDKKRKVFFSFDYDDIFRVNQVRNIGILSGDEIVQVNRLEKVKYREDSAIKKWIKEKMQPCSCVVVLVGSQTASSKWVKYEIKQAIDSSKGLFGIYIHDLKDKEGRTSEEGIDPLPAGYDCHDMGFLEFMSDYSTYNWIKSNLSDWVENAIKAQQVRQLQRQRIERLFMS